ncbi:MAG: hypothetical protein ACYC7J_20460 [Syntrophales bacterium]
MKKNGFAVLAALLVLILAAPVWAWQGRMAGLGDPSGLIQDESDYLTHPAAIAGGAGTIFYGDYRLTYDKAKSWDYNLSLIPHSTSFDYSASGRSWKNAVQLGAAFAAGAGRMGIFLEYAAARGKYDGRENYRLGPFGADGISFDLKDDLDRFSVRMIYGLPVGQARLGWELQVAHRNEEKEERMIDRDWSGSWTATYRNDPWAAEDSPHSNLYPYLIPFQSKYWEAQAKASVEGLIGPAAFALTLKAGLPFASDNRYSYEIDYVSAPETDYRADMDGKVKGFNAGGDFWLRVPLSETSTLPFVISTEYRTIKRDGSRAGAAIVNYDHEATSLFIKAGGGIDFTPTKATRLATGLYYDYRSAKQSTYNDYSDPSGGGGFLQDIYRDLPRETEHRLTLKALAEHELTTAFILRGGLNIFTGRVKSEYAYAAYRNGSSDFSPLRISPSGYHLGLNAAIGATVKLDRISLEPFINAGYVKYDASGDGTLGESAARAEFSRANWLVGGGLSARF